MSKRALLSVYDKRGISELAQGLAEQGFELLASGGTLTHLQAEGISAIAVDVVTGQSEIFGGRVKTLHPAIFGGLLMRRSDEGDRAEAQLHSIAAIDVVACNLYPFADALKARAKASALVEQIDIGGPAMIRAAAKNCAHVYALTDPDDYPAALSALAGSDDAAALRKRLAAKAFALTASYDALIAAWWQGVPKSPPQRLVVPLEKVRDLRYGENPHQKFAAHYRLGPNSAEAGFRQLSGPQPSYNNVLDLHAAKAAIADFDESACLALKHGNPCGLALSDDQAEAFRRARAGDRVAIYGGVVAFNRPLQLATVAAMRAVFLEVVLAPEVTPDALERLKRRANTRVFATVAADGSMDGTLLSDLAIVGQGESVLVQQRDRLPVAHESHRVVSRSEPSADQMRDLQFANRAVKHVKSNAIALARDGALVGVGAGQMSRVKSVEIAIAQAGERAKGAVLASDAFFPFADGAQLALAAGVGAIIQPGGSKRDGEVIAACDEVGAVMVLTGQRHFRH